MELLSAEAKKLNSLIGEWWSHPKQELEATFGIGGSVSMTDFLRVTQRLRSKGYELMPQEDKLNILTPDQLRFTLSGFGVIQQYCRDNRIKDKEFTVMIKDRTGAESQIDLEEYAVRIKARREEDLSKEEGQVQEMLEQWEVQDKAFRLIRRWTFKGHGFRIDLSMVRQTSRDTRGRYRYIKNFHDEPVTRMKPVYEIEVELMRDELTDEADARNTLVRIMGEVLRGLQNHTLLITQSKRNRVLEGYKNLVKTNQFRGVQPKTLEAENMNTDTDSGVPNIRNGFNVTDKADGLRCMGYVDSGGELFLIDMGMQVYRTGLQNKSCATSLVDGEWITRDKLDKPMQQFAIFDIYHVAGGDDVTQVAFRGEDGGGRWKMMQDWLARWSGGVKAVAVGLSPKTTLAVVGKEFMIADPGPSIFAMAARVLDTPKQYHTDGLIFTSNKDPIPGAGETYESQFKWKPSLENTIDFLVMFEKDSLLVNEDKIVNGIHPDTGSTVKYKSMRLYVSSTKDPAAQDPRATILYEQALPGRRRDGKRPPRRPILFTPRDHPDLMASYAYGEIEYDFQSSEEYVLTEKTKEPIMDRSIVEFRYDPKAAPGWRWIPSRIRHDKTERFMKGVILKTMNGEGTANSVWNSIHDPITPSMIRTGTEKPSAEEMEEFFGKAAEEKEIEKKYYERKASDLELSVVKGLRDFHNRHVKGHILYNRILHGGNKTLIDVACGKAGDLSKVRRGRAAFMLGIDIAGENIMNEKDGAYARYMSDVARFGRDKMPVCVYAIGNSSKSLIDGEAASTAQDRDILRSLFGKVAPEGAVPSYIDNNAAGALSNGADGIVCMFALHYFFENEESLTGLVNNIRDTLKVGGYFGGACFDGDSVYEFLKDTKRGESRIGAQGDNILWTLTKEYDNDDYSNNDSPYGIGIDVDFITIGMRHREYLVPFNFFVEKMRGIGCELLTDKEAADMKIGKGSELFGETYEKVKREYNMPEPVRQFSALNRWFVFVRRGEAGAPASVIEDSSSVGPSVTRPGMSKPLEQPSSLGDTEYSDAMKNTVIPSEFGIIPTLPPTAPGAPSDRLPTVPVESDKKVYAQNEIFLFYPDAAASIDKLKSGYKDAGRWLAPFAPFSITDDGVDYPSMEHYMAAMKFKYASNRPDLAGAIFGRDGEIHAEFLAKRLVESGGRPLPVDKDHEFLKAEAEMVRSRSTPGAMTRKGIEFNETKWAVNKDKVIEEAVKQRLTRDAKFKKIVESAKSQNKYLLYYTGSSGGSELGGVRRSDGTIDGDNRIGKVIMRLAGF